MIKCNQGIYLDEELELDTKEAKTQSGSLEAHVPILPGDGRLPRNTCYFNSPFDGLYTTGPCSLPVQAKQFFFFSPFA